MAFSDSVRPLYSSNTAEFELLSKVLLKPHFVWDGSDVSNDHNVFIFKVRH